MSATCIAKCCKEIKIVVVKCKIVCETANAIVRAFCHGTLFMQLSRRQIIVLIVNDSALTVLGYNLCKHIHLG